MGGKKVHYSFQTTNEYKKELAKANQNKLYVLPQDFLEKLCAREKTTQTLQKNIILCVFFPSLTQTVRAS